MKSKQAFSIQNYPVQPAKYLYALVSVFFLLLACSENPVQVASPGSGTETIGKLVYPNGMPATGALVHLRPSDYLPDVTAKVAAQHALKTIASTFTDSLGHFTFDSIAPGTYTLECLDGEPGNGALIDSVVIENPDSITELATDTLKPLGAISGQIQLPESLDASTVRAMIYGLDRVETPDSAGHFEIVGLAEGKYDLHIAGPGVSLDLRGDRGALVLAGETTAIPASVTSFNDTGLVGYWSFDENSGQMAYDASGNGNTGVLGNTAAADFADPVWTVGKIGSCLQFDSVNDTRVIIDAPTSSMDSLSAFTYTAWINSSEYGSRYSRILSREITPYRFDDFFLCVDGMYGLGVGLADVNDSIYGANSDSGLVQLNVWQHVAATYDDFGDKAVHIYINGVEVAYERPPDTLAAPLRLTSNPLTIGNILQVEQRAFIGKIDEVKVYNRVLSQTEIQAEMNRQ